MKSEFSLGILAFTTLLLSACEGGEESQPQLLITRITPGTTMLGGNSLNSAMVRDTMVISGQHFSAVGSENLVSVASVPARVIAASENEIRAKVPEGVPFSYVDVEVARNGYGKATSRISVKETHGPAITGISPTGGPVGTVITVYGKNLLETLEANMVEFTGTQGGTAKVPIRPFSPVSASPDSLQIRVPSGAGTGRIYLYARPAQNVGNAFSSMGTPVFTVTP